MLRDIISNDWFTIFLVLGLGFITTSKLLFAHRFKDFIAVIGNSKYLKIYAREQKFIDGFDALLFLNGVVSISIFAFISYTTLVNPQNLILISFSNYFLELVFYS